MDKAKIHPTGDFIARRVPWRLKLWYQSIVWRSSYSYWPHARFRSHQALLDLNYDLAIEGFPRSGNTYAREMLQQFQAGRLSIKSHGHTPPFVLWAVQHGKPVILLIRSPHDAIVSWHIFTGLPLTYIAAQYDLYYRILLPYREQVCLVQFDHLKASFVDVIRACNDRFGLDLSTAFDEEACRQAAFQNIDRPYKGMDGELDPSRVNRPLAARQNLKQRIEAHLSPAYESALARANGVYAAWLGERKQVTRPVPTASKN
ncbi:MAG: hypothetical protein KGS61_14665 [Verrucomicrobia bacterium]|nr:hypothetical protein [Verrucomicrobiota bacterium]